MLSYNNSIKHSGFIFIWLFCSNVVAACNLFEPRKSNLAPDTSGQLITLQWPGHSRDIYRLQIIANIPEGGVFWSLDTQLQENQFAYKLPSNLAAIKVQISSGCSDAELNSVQSLKPIIFVNEKQSCSLATEDWLQDGWSIKFKPRNNILNYSFNLYEVNTTNADPVKGNLIHKLDVKQPYLSLQDEKIVINMKEKLNSKPSEIGRKYLVSVLPRCAAGLGLPMAFLLN
jgi:hypothetical protein